MKQKLQDLLSAILALLRTPPEEDNEESIEQQKAHIVELQENIDSFYGDHEINDPEVRQVIDDIVEVAADAEPHSEHAEVPDFTVKGEKKKKSGTTPSAPPSASEAAGKEDADRHAKKKKKAEAEAEAEPAEDGEEEESEPEPEPKPEQEPDDKEEPEIEETAVQRKRRLKAEAEAAKSKPKKKIR